MQEKKKKEKELSQTAASGATHRLCQAPAFRTTCVVSKFLKGTTSTTIPASDHGDLFETETVITNCGRKGVGKPKNIKKRMIMSVKTIIQRLQDALIGRLLIVPTPASLPSLPRSSTKRSSVLSSRQSAPQDPEQHGTAPQSGFEGVTCLHPCEVVRRSPTLVSPKAPAHVRRQGFSARMGAQAVWLTIFRRPQPHTLASVPLLVCIRASCPSLSSPQAQARPPA
jgi:hypothetical protein